MSNPKTEDYVGAAVALQQMLDAVIDYEDELPKRALDFLAGPAYLVAEEACAAMDRLNARGELNPATEPEMANLVDVVVLTGAALAGLRKGPVPLGPWVMVLSMHGALGRALQAVEGAQEVAHA